ncbi:MAG: glycerol-3-phosphate responsive antiterminator [Christensenellales bacterium]
MSKTQEILDTLIENPVIAAVRSPDKLDSVIASSVKVVFTLFGGIGELEEQCKRLNDAGKLVFLHIDLIDGLRPDAVGIKYVVERMKPAGIITTKGSCIKIGHELGVFTIQRVFMLDSSALKSGIQNVTSCKPDLVEILPGVCERALLMAKINMATPFIAGGFIESKEDIIAALRVGAVAVSTSCEALWGEID